MRRFPSAADRGPLDRWILSRLASTTATVTDALGSYEPLAAATAVADLVDDLSNWYVRRSRRRFWRTDPDAPAGDTLAAQATLHDGPDDARAAAGADVPVRLGHHVAPPDRSRRRGVGAPGRLARGRCGGIAPDADLEAQMALARRLTSLGRAARGEASVKVRQPLKRALVFLPADSPEILRRDRGGRAQRRRDRHRRGPERRDPVRARAELQDARRPLAGPRQGARSGVGRARQRRRGGRTGGRAVHHRRPGWAAGRAVARGRGTAGPGPAGVRRVPRGRRGGGAGPEPRRRACASGGCPATSCA